VGLLHLPSLWLLGATAAISFIEQKLNEFTQEREGQQIVHANHGVVQQKLNEFTLHAACGRGEEGEKNAAPRRIGNFELVRVIRESNRLDLERVIRVSK
jgi:hypothetical protein